MSLLTPPSTGHRSDKENRFQSSNGQSRVVWSQHLQFHDISSSPKPLKCTSATRQAPAKSILKRPSYPLLPLLVEEPREMTPEPDDPLMDLHYLEGPVFTILSPLATMQELNEAYGRLMARLRLAVQSSTDADASWPLFQPIRQCRREFVEALLRDLRRALEDPAEKFLKQPQEGDGEEEDTKAAASLPSPKHSPKKKKGVSAEQVKHARDLCTTSHSAMKFLALIMALPAIYKLFDDIQLRQLLTEVLAIPSADNLPTPNARKTCALAIWVIQVQRLSRSVLQPLSIRIAHVIRRGIDGELGKEGKKGSANDGLKAVHDLTVFQPTTFVPAFTNILDSILNNLLAPTLTLRQQACQALSGIVLGLVTIPRSSTSIHTRISNIVADYITQVSESPKPIRRATPSPSKLAQEAPIFSTLRVTLNATEPNHAAQGPVWALVVIACFVMLLGSTLIHNNKIFRSLSNLLSLSMRHRKSSVRALGCMVWRCVAWVYFLPITDTTRETSLAHDMLKDKRDSIWKALMNVVDVQTGVAIIAAVLGEENADSADALTRTMCVLENMLTKQTNVVDVIDTMRRLVKLETHNVPWKVNKLIIPALFSANPSLLAAEYKSLAVVINEMLLIQPPLEDVRFLTREEIAQEWVFDGMIKLWKQALANLKKFDEAEVSGMTIDLLLVWQGLLGAVESSLEDAGDEESIMEFTRKAADVLVDLLEDADLDLMTSKPTQKAPREAVSTVPGIFTLQGSTNGELKLQVVSEMWRIMYMTFPESNLRRAGERLLSCLTKIEDELVESNDDARSHWVSFCVQALAVCEVDALKMFWGLEAGGCEWDWTEEVRNIVWRTSTEKWSDGGCGWEGAVVLLAVPFTSPRFQILGNDDSKKWEEFLQYAFDKALDYGHDSFEVLDGIAALVSQHQNLCGSASTQVSDLLMSHLDMKEIREIPETLMEFVNETMKSSYPPESGNRDISRWMIRTLTNVIEHCPSGLGSKLLEFVQEGVCVWVADDCEVWSADDYEYEIVPLYAQALFCIQSLRASIDNLEKFGSVIESGFVGRSDKPQLVKDQFESFWNSTYGTWETPIDGWPVCIQRCLGLKPDTTTPENAPLSPLPPSSPVSSVYELPRSCSPEIAPPFDLVLATPSTPTTSLASRHPRDVESQKSVEPLFPKWAPTVSPTSPLRIRSSTHSSPTTPRRAAKRAWTGSISYTAPTSTTPKSKKRRVEGEDKENASPRSFLGQIYSVTERIAMRSPLQAPPSAILNRKTSSATKRQLEMDGEDESEAGLGEKPSPSKKGKFKAEGFEGRQLFNMSSDDDAEEQIVASTLLEASPCVERRGPRWFLESIEVPSFEEVLFNRRLRSSGNATNPSSVRTPSTGGRLIHKMKPSKSLKANFMTDPFTSPLPPPRLPSDLIISKLNRTVSAPALVSRSSSSDDDPRYGQVTPHHLISPAPKKVLHMFDPPSDDSLPSSSPTKSAASRRLGR